MKQVSWMILAITNLLLGSLYLWGADNNRYICAVLWAVIPMANLILYGLLEKNLISNEYGD